jgi:DNA-binding CsgD family transcriptional regulator
MEIVVRPAQSRRAIGGGWRVHDEGSTAQALYGRERELHLLNDLIGRINDQGAALVVRGEAGIGKSALLAGASRRARAGGLRTLSITGTQSETHLPFAGLHQLLRPILSEVADLPDLPDPQRNALLAAFGMRTSPAPPDLFLVALAALELLASVASRAPLLVVVDDAHWLDRSSRDVLTFVARRLEADPIVLLIALRDEFESVFADAALPHYHVEGLDEASAGALLDAHAPGLAPVVRERILTEAMGNPLALVELPAALEAHLDGSTGSSPLSSVPSALPLTSRLERTFAARVSELPDAVRTLMLVAAAADNGGNPATVLSEILAAGALIYGAELTSDVLEPAVNVRLVALNDQRLQFRHPLVRSAIYQAASAAQRRAAHAALATVLAGQLDRSIWHLAASRDGLDETVAVELEAAADRARGRGDLAVAAAALERAAQLTSAVGRRGDRVLRAAEAAFELGRRDVGLHLLHAVEPHALSSRERTRLAWLTENYEERSAWSGAASVTSFIAIADQARLDGDVGLALSALLTIALRCWWSNPDEHLRQAVVEAAMRMPVPGLDPALLTILALAAPIEQGASILERLTRLPAEGSEDPATTLLLCSAASAVGDYHVAARWLVMAVAGLRARGQLGLLAQALVTQAWAAFYLGNWTVAVPAAEEAAQLAEETGQVRWAAAAQLAAGALAACRCEVRLAEALASGAERVFLPMAANPMLAMVQVVRGLAALGDGRYAAAYDELHRIFDPTDNAYHPLVRCWTIGDLAEAATHSGHQDEARVLLDELERLAAKTQSPLLLASLTCARPLLAADATTAEALFQAGLSAPLTEWPLHRARLLLAYGAWLRRQRRVVEARTHLRAAMEALDALGAIPWGDVARKELRAAGETRRPRTPAPRDVLSPQELQIAQLAAEGLSNRAIGQQLYLSHRTVGWHLYRIFPKLGITARSELHAALHDAVTIPPNDP